MKMDSHKFAYPNVPTKIRKANGGIAPNYNNPSKVRKKKTATKAAAKSKSGYMGDATVSIPWMDNEMDGPSNVDVSFRDLANFTERDCLLRAKEHSLRYGI